MKEKYVLKLIEDPTFGVSMSTNFIGYWDGKRYRGEDVWFPGVKENKYDKDVKVYTSKKRAESAVDKLKDKFSYISNAKVETLD
jgi:hypothetical protein